MSLIQGMDGDSLDEWPFDMVQESDELDKMFAAIIWKNYVKTLMAELERASDEQTYRRLADQCDHYGRST